MQQDRVAILTERHARRNFWANVGDIATFSFGASLVSRYTLLPYFVSQLSDNPLLLGLIPALFSLGWLLPQLFTAPLVASLPRRLPYILWVTLFERLPFLALGLALGLWPGLPPWALLTIFFGCYAVHNLSAGLAATAWQDFIARVIPGNRLGVFFGLASALGGALGVVGAWVIDWSQLNLPFPQSVGFLSLVCFAALVVSMVSLALSIEPARPPLPREPLGPYLRGLLPLLRRDAAFRAYLLNRSAIGLAFVGHSFITVAAAARFPETELLLGWFTGALLGATAVANVPLGALADRWGHRQVLELSSAIGVVALILAIVAPSPFWYVLIFVLIGVATAGFQTTGYTLTLTFGTEAERPTYIGLANTALAPVGVIGPLIVAALAEWAGYGALFAATAVVGVVGLVGMWWSRPSQKIVDPAVGRQ
jgi:MFS family permease